MVVSFGDVDRRGHALWVAVADRPEGPFRMARRISDPSEAFSIDGSWLLDDDGRLYLFRCLDFVEEGEPPHGTGIVVQPMRDPLTPAGPPVDRPPGPLPLAPLRARPDACRSTAAGPSRVDDHRGPGAGPEGGAGLLRLQRRQLREGLRDRRGRGRRPAGPLSGPPGARGAAVRDDPGAGRGARGTSR